MELLQGTRIKYFTRQVLDRSNYLFLYYHLKNPEKEPVTCTAFMIQMRIVNGGLDSVTFQCMVQNTILIYTHKLLQEEYGTIYSLMIR